MSRLQPPSPRQIYDLCLAIEKLPASPEQTAAVTLASSMLAPGIRIDLGWDQDAAQPAPNPPTNSESSPLSVLPPHVCDGSGCCKEPEPAAPAVGEDEALLARGDSWTFQSYESPWPLIRDLTARLRAALADVARLEARPSHYEDLVAIEQLQVQVDHYRTGMTEARAALVAAVAEEMEACLDILTRWTYVFKDTSDLVGQVAANIRARARRNDV